MKEEGDGGDGDTDSNRHGNGTEGETQRDRHTDMNKDNWRHPNRVKGTETPDSNRGQATQTRREIHTHT